MPKQTRSRKIGRALRSVGKEIGGAIMEFLDGAVDVTLIESHKQNNSLIQRAEIAELIRDASGPNIKRQIIARQKLQEMGIKI